MGMVCCGFGVHSSAYVHIHVMGVYTLIHTCLPVCKPPEARKKKKASSLNTWHFHSSEQCQFSVAMPQRQ